MEDVLEVYHRPYDSRFPVICMDEKPYQLLGEIREPLSMKSGMVKKEDNEYVRKGMCNIFIFTEPLKGRRYLEVSVRRTKKDWAYHVKNVLENEYPTAEKVVFVMDNLNTHTISSLYETFPPHIALPLAKRMEIHYTPKHGSWLNIAEIELSVLSSQCLKRRVADMTLLETEIKAWQSDRNEMTKSVDWQFSTEDARVKLKSLYPAV